MLLDWHEIDPDAVYARLKAGANITTMPVSTRRLADTYSKLLESHDQIVSIHISGVLSDTVKHARRAAEELGAKNRSLVLYSGLASVALAESVLVAQRVIESGGDFDRVTEAISELPKRCLAEFTVPTLEYLRRGGRISRVQEVMGNLFNLRPVLTFDRGSLKAERRVKTERALGDIVERLDA